MYFDVASGKIGCNICLLGKIKLIGGYLSPCPSGFAWHVSKRKAFIFRYKDSNERRKKLSSGAFKVSVINLIAEVSPNYLLGTSFIGGLFAALDSYKSGKQRIEIRILLNEQECFRVFARIALKTSLFLQLKLAVQYLSGRTKKNVKG